MPKIFLAIGAASIFICCVRSCYVTSDGHLKTVKENGYKAGVSKGKQKAENDYLKKLNQNQAYYENLLEENQKKFEERVVESYNQGKQAGEQKMTEEINSAMTINTKNKRKKKKSGKEKWNQVISENEE